MAAIRYPTSRCRRSMPRAPAILSAYASLPSRRAARPATIGGGNIRRPTCARTRAGACPTRNIPAAGGEGGSGLGLRGALAVDFQIGVAKHLAAIAPHVDKVAVR